VGDQPGERYYDQGHEHACEDHGPSRLRAVDDVERRRAERAADRQATEKVPRRRWQPLAR